MKLGMILSILLFTSSLWGQQGSANLNQVAVGQGISSPAITHTALYSKGFTLENPVAASYQSGYRATGSLDGADSTSLGVDFGVGDTVYGFSVGAYSNACGGCDAFIRGTLSAIWGGFGFGFGVQEDLYTVGMLFNPNGMHRVGVVAEFEDPNGPNNNRNAIGLGYSYVLPQFTFSFDLSNRSLENPVLNSSLLMMTPGIAVRVDMFSISLNYDMYLSDTFNQFSDQIWVGFSVKPFSSWEFAFYGEFVDRWTLMGTYTF